MIQRMSHASIFVLDQDVAKDFYVNKLGKPAKPVGHGLVGVDFELR